MGQVGESITRGTSFNFDRIKHLKFPITLILHDLVLPATESAKK
ncbi:hypothetical protein [Acinetobacter venetianus]